MGRLMTMASDSMVHQVDQASRGAWGFEPSAEAILNDELSFSVFDGYALVKMIGRPEDFDALLAIMAGTSTEDLIGPPL